jgi:hypothetical protein
VHVVVRRGGLQEHRQQAHRAEQRKRAVGVGFRSYVVGGGAGGVDDGGGGGADRSRVRGDSRDGFSARGDDPRRRLARVRHRGAGERGVAALSRHCGCEERQALHHGVVRRHLGALAQCRARRQRERVARGGLRRAGLRALGLGVARGRAVA